MSGAAFRSPSLADLDRLARQEFERLPEVLARPARGVVIRIEDFPDRETEEEMELESPFDLLGLYRGVDLLHKSISDPLPSLDMIFLYRRPILDYWCESGEDLSAILRHVLIHEIGHHFGFSDEAMARIEESVADED